MSLILEALKKLEREKQAGDRGLVVLSHLPWVGAKAGRGGLRVVSIAVLALMLLVVGALGIWHRQEGPPAANDPRPGNRSAATPTVKSAAPTGPGSGAPVLAPSAPITPPPAATDMRSVAIRPEFPASRLPGPDPAPTALPDAPVATAGAAEPGPGSTPSKANEIHLNAISVRDGHPVAILNDRLVREGDSFDGIRVLRIGEAEVEVEVGGVRRILRF